MVKFDTLYISIPDKHTYKQVCKRLGELKFKLGTMDTKNRVGYVYISTNKNNRVSYSDSDLYLNSNENGMQGTLVTLYTKEFVNKFKP
jgi:hypothetical protein